MSLRRFCDYPGCQNVADVRITEDTYLPDWDTTHVRSLDACREHRTQTHPGWWCNTSLRPVRNRWGETSVTLPARLPPPKFGEPGPPPDPPPCE